MKFKKEFLRKLLMTNHYVYEIEGYLKYYKQNNKELIDKLEKVNDILDEIRSEIMENSEGAYD